jgi:PTH1 family peptidyl-tRNA hydrolase
VGKPLEDGPVLVVGLGNPGEGYRWNRHNVGFLFLDYLAQATTPGGWNGRNKFGGELMDVRLTGRRIYLFKPLSYMNLSGGPTSRAAGFFKIPASRLLVCYDDVALAFGSLRLREKGSAGGQKGMKDILSAFGCNDIARFRFGIDGLRGRKDLSDFVLSNFGREEQEQLPDLFEHGLKALRSVLKIGVEKASSRYNRTVKQEAAD